MNVIIAGGRDFVDYNFLDRKVSKILSNIEEPITIVSGGAKGADTLGKAWANLHNVESKEFLPDWKAFGKSAGYKRNVVMADNADALIAFWDGKSRGTKHMIDIAKSKQLKVRVIRY